MEAAEAKRKSRKEKLKIRENEKNVSVRQFVDVLVTIHQREKNQR